MTLREVGRPLLSGPPNIRPAPWFSPKGSISQRNTLGIIRVTHPRHESCPPGHLHKELGTTLMDVVVTYPGRYCLSQCKMRLPLHRAHCPGLSHTEASGSLWEVLLSFDTGTPTLIKFQNEAHLGEAFWLPASTPMASNPYCRPSANL